MTKVFNELEDAICDTPFDPEEISTLLKAVDTKKNILLYSSIIYVNISINIVTIFHIDTKYQIVAKNTTVEFAIVNITLQEKYNDISIGY